MSTTHVNQPIPRADSTNTGAGNQFSGVVLLSAAQAAGTINSNDIFNPCAKGVRVFCDITNDNGGTVTVKLQAKDPVSKKYVDITGATSPAWATATQTRTLTVYPGITTAAGTATTNTEASNFVSSIWRVVVTVAAATVTFSVGADYLL